MRGIGITGAWIHEPQIFPDHRGRFHEWFQGSEFRTVTGRDLKLAQANCSVSSRGTLRGIHFADVPPGQAKYVTCVRGTILDVIVDIRVGSPTYRRWESVRLDDVKHRAVYLSEGLGHGFMTLTDSATVVYLCSEGYNPAAEHGIHPLDPTLGIDWPEGVEPLMSDKDAQAPMLVEAEKLGLFSHYEDCVSFYDSLC